MTAGGFARRPFLFQTPVRVPHAVVPLCDSAGERSALPRDPEGLPYSVPPVGASPDAEWDRRRRGL